MHEVLVKVVYCGHDHIMMQDAFHAKIDTESMKIQDS